MCRTFVLFFQCGVAWRIKLVTLSSSWTGPFHDFVKDAWWQNILDYKQHELKLMWTHVQLAWWWYLELRRDRGVICIMRYEPNLVLGWIVVELMSVQPIEDNFWIYMGTTTTFEKGGGLIAVTGIMQTEHESTWAWAHAAHKQEYSVTKHLWQSHEMGPFSYCRGLQV